MSSMLVSFGNEAICQNSGWYIVYNGYILSYMKLTFSLYQKLRVNCDCYWDQGAVCLCKSRVNL